VTVVDGPALLADLATLDSLADRQLAASVADERHIADLLVDQIEFANLLLLNKCDRLAPVRVPPPSPQLLFRLTWPAKHRGRGCMLQPPDGSGIYAGKVQRLVLSALHAQADADRAEALLKQLNPLAAIRRTAFCEVDLAEVLHTRRCQGLHAPCAAL
jgi:G3E family GTPase